MHDSAVLLACFERAIHCGALTDEETAALTGLTT